MSLTGKPALTTAAPFVNGGFWPDLAVGELLSKYRIPPEYADDTITWGMTLAAVNVDLELAPVEAAIKLLGYNTLAAYNLAHPDLINGLQKTVIYYQHAVYCRAKAGLLQQFNSLNRRAIAEDAAKEAPGAEQYWLDESAAFRHKLFKQFLPDTVTTANANTHVALL